MDSFLPYELSKTPRLKKSQYCRYADTHDWDRFASLSGPLGAHSLRAHPF
ncbi:hypothetical protein BDV29DRAFT_162971 [Aspergillus leporis]|uniref:Uncharacterized protein n=1 Tax=Aspergillus leporis TaxID=41062 RepID=A0A5N5WKV3_9EURO|nr:hypothetical protein BDV29DRAFT_162971 [Aspergillus leporis]